MGNLHPYWDRRLPILGVDAGFAGHRWDMVVKGFSGPLGWASPGENLDHHEPVRKEHFGLSTRRVPFSPHLAVKATRSTCRDGEPGYRRLCAIYPREFSQYGPGIGVRTLSRIAFVPK